jgi:DNA-binding SARP family transcriptional activator
VAHEEVLLRLLGPIRIRRDGADRPIGSGRRAALLVVLALSGEATREQLIAAVWGDDPPPSASGNVYTHVNALREALGGRMLTREDGVYRLRVTGRMVDVRRFEALRDRARGHRAGDRPADELAALDEALGLWDGDALAGVPGPYAEAQRARLRELRIAAGQRRAELLIELGRPSEAVDALRDLVVSHPLREPLPELLMRALEARGSREDPARTRDIVRAVVFLGPGATVDEVGLVTGLPAAVVAEATDVLVTTPSGTVVLRDPAAGRALYGRTTESARIARHEFFAQLIADSFGPPERVAAQLLRAGPAPLSPAASRWLFEHIDELVRRSPDAAVALLRRAHLQHLPDPEVHVALSVWLARLLFGQGRDAVAEAGWVAARTPDPDVQAEMLWIAACGHDRRGSPVAAADLARSALGRREHPQHWLDRFRELVLRLRLRLPGVPTEPRHGRAGVVGDSQLSAYRGSVAAEGPR